MKEPKKITATFFFCDIEGSTKLAFKLGHSFAELMQEYHQTVREGAERYKGRLIDTAGDGVFVAFEQADQAIRAAADIQTAFQQKEWYQGVGLRVRMGIHTGEAIATPSGFVGLEVHRASRVCSAAHGGEIIITESTKKGLQDPLPADINIRHLGDYLLKDFEEPEGLYQLVVPGMPQSFPLPRTSIPTHTIAVLPLVDMDHQPDRVHLGEGIADDLIISLGKNPGISVVSRAASFAYQSKDKDPRTIGKELGATVILQGRIQDLGNRLKITIELIDARSGHNVWSDRFIRSREELVYIQEELADQIAQALHLKLFPRVSQPTKRNRTANIVAYDFYLRGRRFYNQFSRTGITFAKQMFEKAIEEDRYYARAYAGLADCHSYLYMYYENSLENLERALECSLKAIELNHLLPEAHVAHGLALSLEGHHEASNAAFERAIELDPKLFNAFYQYARTSFAQGKLERARQLFETAYLLRPNDYQSPLLLAQVYEDLGDEESAKRVRQEGIQIVERILRLNPGDTRAFYMGANGLVALGQKERGIRWLQQALNLEPDDAMVLYNASCIYSLLSMEEEALDCMEGSINAGLTHWGWYENDRNLDNIRHLDRFIEMTGKLAERESR